MKNKYLIFTFLFFGCDYQKTTDIIYNILDIGNGAQKQIKLFRKLGFKALKKELIE